MIRLLVADDHTIVRQGVVSLLEAAGDCQVVAQASDGVEAVEQALATRPDVAVLDIGMPRLSGLEAVRRIRQEVPHTRVLVLTMHEEEEYVLHIVKAGASGYLVKDSATTELLAAVRALARGRRERDLANGTLIAAVCPGLIDTDASRPWFDDMSAARRPVEAAAPILDLALHDGPDPTRYGELVRDGRVLSWTAEIAPESRAGARVSRAA